MFLMEALGGCSAVGDHVRMCQSGALAKAAFRSPCVFAHQPLEEDALCPLTGGLAVFPICWVEACVFVQKTEQLAGPWNLGVLPESGSLVLAFIHPFHIPASCIHLRCLPETFPGETAASCLREEILKAPEVLNLGDWCHFSPLATHAVFNSSLATIRGWRTTLEFFICLGKGWYRAWASGSQKSGWLFGVKSYSLTGFEKLYWEKDRSGVILEHGLRFSNLRYLKLCT